MDDRRFLGGLSGGASFLAVAGAFWLGLGISALAGKAEWWVFAPLTLLQAGSAVGLLWAATRLRRRTRSLFPKQERSDGREKQEVRHILVWFCWTALVQAILIGAAVWWCLHTHEEQMIWPAIGLIVSLHFAPLARIFHVRAYYATACAGIIISLTAFTWVTAAYGLTFLGGALAAVMWISAVYILSRSQAIVHQAIHEKWLV